MLRPDTAMNPYNDKQTPPITQLGIVLMNAITGEMNASTIAIHAAPKIETTDAFFVIATQPIDSPYVVFGTPPKIEPTNEPTPSPNNVRCKPGSWSKSFSIIDEMFLWSAICSANTTNDTGMYKSAIFATPAPVNALLVFACKNVKSG